MFMSVDWKSIGTQKHSRLALLVLIALAHRAVIVAWSSTIATDGASYLSMAEVLFRGEIERALGFTYHPLFPLVAAMLGSILGTVEAGAYFATVVASSLAVIPLYLLIQLWWNERIAFWSCLLYALHPVLSIESAEVHPTGLFLSLFIASIALGVLALKRNNWWLYPLAGATAALCYLTRPEGVYVVLFDTIALLAAVFRLIHSQRRAGTSVRLSMMDRWYPWASMASGVLSAIFVYALLTAPYVLWLHGFTGRWTMTARSAGLSLLSAGTGPLTRAPDPSSSPNSKTPSPKKLPSEVKPPPPSSVIGEPSSDPGRAASPGRTSRHGNPHSLGTLLRKLERAFYWPLIPPFIVGIVCCRRLGGRWPTLLAPLGIALFSFAPPILLMVISETHLLSYRYLLPGIIFLLPWMAAGCVQIFDSMVHVAAQRRAKIRWVFVAIPYVILFGTLLMKTMGPQRAEEISMIDAGRWLRLQHIVTPPRILTSSEKIAYYGGAVPLEFSASGKPRWVYQGGSWEADIGQPGVARVSDATRQSVEACKTWAPTFVFLDERSLRLFPADFPRELEEVGFEQVAIFGKVAHQRGLSIWAFRLRETR
jgi:4-amino-4-deoxy-L-arabinose transferase-like glycosyltransferase